MLNLKKNINSCEIKNNVKIYLNQLVFFEKKETNPLLEKDFSTMSAKRIFTPKKR